MFLAMGLGATLKPPTLHNTLKTLSLRGRSNIYPIAHCKLGHVQLIPFFQLVFGHYAKLAQYRKALAVFCGKILYVAELWFIEALFSITHLHGSISVFLLNYNLRYCNRTCRKKRHGNNMAFFIKYLSHSDFFP